MNTLSGKRPRTDSPPRIIVSLDLDCFYAAVVIRERPHLVNEPVGVLQKNFIVTTNYVARKMGIPKMGPAAEAKQKFPQLHLIDGSDLAPFRAASAEVMQAVRGFLAKRCELRGKRSMFIPCEKLNLDEIFIDLTSLVQLEDESTASDAAFCGHINGSTSDPAMERALIIGSQLVSELRMEVTRETRLTLSGGISSNKMLAKLGGGMHKPNEQTVFFKETAPEYVGALPPHKIPGIGYSMRKKLEDFSSRVGVPMDTTLQMREYFSKHEIELQRLSGNPALARLILQWCVGEDASVVKNSGLLKTLSCGVSFAGCSNMTKLSEKLEQLAASLILRLAEDYRDSGFRQPKTFSVSYSMKNSNTLRGSRSATIPSNIIQRAIFENDARVIKEAQSFFVQTAIALLKTHANVSKTSRFNIALLSLSATNFTASAGDGENGSIQRFLLPAGKTKAIDKSRLLSENVTAETGIVRKSQSQNVFFTGNSPMKQERKSPLSVDAEAASPKRPKKSQSACAARCPICNDALPLSNVMQNAHIDACIRGKVSPPKRRTSKNSPATKACTKPIESYFTRKT